MVSGAAAVRLEHLVVGTPSPLGYPLRSLKVRPGDYLTDQDSR
jgi:hypothetical protein